MGGVARSLIKKLYLHNVINSEIIFLDFFALGVLR